MAASWTPVVVVFLVGLLLVLGADSATAAAVRGPQARGQGHLGGLGGGAEETGPLALLVLRAADSPLGLDPEDVDGGLKQAVEDAASRAASPLRAPEGVVGYPGDTVFLRAAKRQVRYHQCYFNPISCFG